MNYEQAKKKTIKILNQYSNGGTITPSTEGNVRDYILRFPELFDICQKEIATTAKYINALHTETQTASEETAYTSYTLPDNFFKLNKIENESQIVPWIWQGKNKYAVRSNLDGDINFFYFALPATIEDTVADNYEFEIDEEACQAMPYFVASQVLIDDPLNKSVSDKLYAIYQSKLSNMTNTDTKGIKAIKNTLFSGDYQKKLF